MINWRNNLTGIWKILILFTPIIVFIANYFLETPSIGRATFLAIGALCLVIIDSVRNNFAAALIALLIFAFPWMKLFTK